MHPAFDKGVRGSLRKKGDIFRGMEKVTSSRQNKKATRRSRLKRNDLADNAMGIIPRKISQNNMKTSLLELGVKSLTKGKKQPVATKYEERFGGAKTKGAAPPVGNRMCEPNPCGPGIGQGA